MKIYYPFITCITDSGAAAFIYRKLKLSSLLSHPFTFSALNKTSNTATPMENRFIFNIREFERQLGQLNRSESSRGREKTKLCLKSTWAEIFGAN